MKHIFVVNPVSGKGKNAKNYIPTIEKYIKEKNLNADIYVTTASRDGMRYVEEVAKKGEYIKNALLDMKHVTDVAGMGMMLGIELDVDVKPIVNTLMDNGLLVLTAKHKMRLLPPLNITQEELDKGLAILKETLEKI